MRRLDSNGSAHGPLTDFYRHDNEPLAMQKRKISWPVEWLSAFQGSRR